MNDIRKLKEQQKDSHPAFGFYVECMTRTLFTGIATFSLVAASTYFAQKAFRNYLMYSEKNFILVSSIVSSVVAYRTTSLSAKDCQDAWMAAEDKVTYLSQLVDDDE